MTTLTLHAEHLRALLTVASDAKKYPRRQLYGAHFHAGRRGVIGMATTGTYMLVIQCSAIPAPDNYWFAPGCWKVPKDGTVELANSGEGESFTASLAYPGGALSWRQDDASGSMGMRFESWERSVPREVSGEPAAFNPDFLGALNKAAGILGHRNGPRIKSNGTGPALVAFDDPFVFGVIMPMRAELLDAPPEWFAPRLSVAA